jgi:hypothetical protein
MDAGQLFFWLLLLVGLIFWVATAVLLIQLL